MVLNRPKKGGGIDKQSPIPIYYQIMSQLRDKIAALSSPELEEEFGAAAGSQAPPSEEAVRSDALSALVNLGYQRSAAEKAINAALAEGGDVSVESILRRTLRRLAKP